MTFPVDDKGAEIVYSSHCLEHLDDATVDRVMTEARRMCRGHLVLKLPDFDEVLLRWTGGDSEYFNHLGMNGVVKTWRSAGFEDTIVPAIKRRIANTKAAKCVMASILSGNRHAPYY